MLDYKPYPPYVKMNVRQQTDGLWKITKLHMFQTEVPSWTNHTAKDVTNLRAPTGGGSQDASLLLQHLLFWMSPSQREQAPDL
mmetsp:Transcript_26561/g.74635  ORF Transcript_26561/g.74635 Transcript_26561/m.74635 type:complete len:83 (-) Transcript_26561:1140-1388(-)